MNDRFLVFVYGSLLSGFHNHRLLEGGGADRLGDARTCAGGWNMLDLGAYPGLVLLDDPDAGAAVVGEVYEVGEAVLARLDQLEGYPTFYDRDLVEVSCGGKVLSAWVYHLAGRWTHDRRVTPVVPGNDWRAHRPDMARKRA